MAKNDQNATNRHMTRKKIDGLETWITTLKYYKQELTFFLKYCEAEGITEVLDITPDLIRAFMLSLETKGRNEGGRHAAFRSVRVFLRWYEAEAEPEAWANPIRKVKPPKVTNEHARDLRR